MVNSLRIKKYNESENKISGPVLYWMNRDMRIDHNWALIHAQSIAQENKQPLIVVYNLVKNYMHGGMRQWDFKIKALQELEEVCKKHSIHFSLIIDKTGIDTPKLLEKYIAQHTISYLVTDMSPLRNTKNWHNELIKKISIPFDCVDAHNIIPVWYASDKQEFAAHTLRKKIYQLIPEFLDSFPKIKKNLYLSSLSEKDIDWDALLYDSSIKKNPPPVTWCIPGSRAGYNRLNLFLKNKIDTYATDRNDPNRDGQSGLSPYLHYGMISAQQIALQVLEHAGKKDIRSVMDPQKNGSKSTEGIRAFLEELIIRRELADNFCWYNEHYDSVKGLPHWAQETLDAHTHDVREYTYTLHEFEHAQTHDPLWNAAQQQMIDTGKMHGYMRMYWAKKILEWTKSPKDALAIAIKLNDTYELDGRDPNGYVGILWSIGGLHDRPWFNRDVFGMIRYMAYSGCKKKFDVDAYIAQWSQSSLL